jgi:DNA-binding PucR family transcriptional regulator
MIENAKERIAKLKALYKHHGVGKLNNFDSKVSVVAEKTPVAKSRLAERASVDPEKIDRLLRVKKLKVLSKRIKQKRSHSMTSDELNQLCWKKFKTPAWACSTMKIALVKAGVI